MERKNKTILDQIVDFMKTQPRQAKNQFMKQLLAEKDLQDALRSAGYVTKETPTETALTDEDLRARARDRFGILTLLEKIDEITKASLLPTWGAIQGLDIDVTASASVPNNSWTVICQYTVPIGKALLIYDWSLVMNTSDSPIAGLLYNGTNHIIISYGGGTKGFQTPFTKPKRLTEEKQVQIQAHQITGSTQIGVHAHFGGILVES